MFFFSDACPTSENLLSDSKTYIRSIKANGVSLNVSIFDNSSSHGYTFPSSASSYSITVNFAQPLLVDRAGLSSSNVQAYNFTLDQSPEYPTYSGQINSSVYTDGTDLDKSASITFEFQQTNDQQPPTNVRLRIHGCDMTTLATKAQIEVRETSTAASSICPITNILQPENMADYQAIGDIVTLENAYENKKGTSFVLLQNPVIRAYFKSNVSISTVALQQTYNNKVSNILKYSLNYVTLDGNPYTDPQTGQIVTYTSDANLVIQHDIIPNLKGLNLTILQTSGGIPTFFRLMVLGCYKSTEINYFILQTTTTTDAAGPLTKQRTTITTPRTPSPMCTNITNLAKNGLNLFSKVKINNQVVANDALANPFALTKLPTTISITFKSVSSPLDS